MCQACGHIWNAAYEPTLNSVYNEDYYYSCITASSQAFGYQSHLAQEVDQLVGMNGRTVVEIGCGDGFFLKSLHILGARAIGFEPSSTFEIAKSQPGLEVFNEHFRFDGAQWAHEPVDVVVLRHVLEHMASPKEVLEALGSRCFRAPGPEFLFLEVPNVFQILRENLYFDFYNDHIHYFSYASLIHALALAGWKPLARIGFSDEFIRVLCVKTSRRIDDVAVRNESELSLNNSLVVSATKTFQKGLEQWKSQLTEIIQAQRRAGNRIAVWGAGVRGAAMLSGLGLPGDSYDYVVDSDPNKHGKFLPMVPQPIRAPEQLRQEPVGCVLVTSYTYFDEILEQLDWFRSDGGKVIRAFPSPEVV